MAPSLAAIALYRTEEEAQAALEALERKGFVIKELLTPPAYSHGNASAEEWSGAQPPVSVGLFVSQTTPAGVSVSEGITPKDTPVVQGASPGSHASAKPRGHVVVVYSQAKDRAIETLSSKNPVQLYLY